MKKISFFLVLVPAIFFLVNTEKALADPSGCQGAAGCVASSECKTKSNDENPVGYCSSQNSGDVCCETKNSTNSTGSGIEIPTGTGLPSGDIMSVLSKTLDWIEGVFLTLSLIAFAIVGIMFLFSMGSSSSAAHTNAKTYFSQAVIALLVVGGSYILIKTINYLLQG